MAGMRMAADPEVVEAISRHLQTDQVPAPAANHMAAEMVTHPQSMRTDALRLKGRIQELKDEGYGDELAQALAVESMEEDIS